MSFGVFSDRALGRSSFAPPNDASGWRAPAHWALAVLLGGVTAIRWHYLDIPLERDEGEFAYGGQLILQGEVPYESMYAMKLPGIYLVYALIQAVFGQSVRGIHLGLLVVNLATIGLMYSLVRRLFDNATGLIAAAMFAILTFSVGLLGTMAQAEHFVLLPAVAGALVLLSAEASPRWWKFFLGGVLFGLALLVKQHGAAFTLFGLAYVATVRPREWTTQPAMRLGQLGWLAAGAALPLALTCATIATLGSWDKFVFWTFTYPREYVQQESVAGAWSNFKRELGLRFVWAELVWLLSPLGLAIVIFVHPWRTRRNFVGLWTLASCVAILPGWYFRYHYFVYLAPALALLTAVALAASQQKLAQWRWTRPLGAGLICGVLGWTLCEQLAFVLPHSPTELSRAFFPGVFAEAPEIGRLIAEHSSPDDRVAILGSEPELLFYANRRSATGHIYMYPLMEEHPFALEMQLQAIREIEAARPKIWIVCEFFDSWAIRPDSNARILDWSREYVPANYQQVARIELAADAPARFMRSAIGLASEPKSGSLLYIMRRNDVAATAPTTAQAQTR